MVALRSGVGARNRRQIRSSIADRLNAGLLIIGEDHLAAVYINRAGTRSNSRINRTPATTPGGWKASDRTYLSSRTRAMQLGHSRKRGGGAGVWITRPRQDREIIRIASGSEGMIIACEVLHWKEVGPTRPLDRGQTAYSRKRNREFLIAASNLINGSSAEAKGC